MKILDESGLTHYSQKLSKTNKVISLKCTSVYAFNSANTIVDPMIATIAQNITKFCNTNNATLVLKDNGDNDRGVASYVGNGATIRPACVGYIEMYVFDSGNTYAQAKIMVNNGTVKKMS